MADLNELRAALRTLPVPEPRPGFEDRVLARASAAHTMTARGERPALRRPATWWAAAAGALAASIAWMAVGWWRTSAPETPRLELALHESREVPLVIDSERELAGATIRVFASGSIALTGYEQQPEIAWQTTLTRGPNLLSLPVIAREPGEGRIVAEIEHEGRVRRVIVAMHVAGGMQ